MKKLILLVCFFLLFGCKVGEFPENRNRLHELGHEKKLLSEVPGALRRRRAMVIYKKTVRIRTVFILPEKL